MSKTVKDYVDNCVACQKKARAVVKDRVPIYVIPRDEIPFDAVTHVLSVFRVCKVP